MARPLRIEIEDGVYHVTTRGWERRLTNESFGALAKRFGNVSTSSISQLARRAESRRREDPASNRLLRRLEKALQHSH